MRKGKRRKLNKNGEESDRDAQYTVCPGSSDPFYIVSQLYKMGHYFLDTQYLSIVCIFQTDREPEQSFFYVRMGLAADFRL